MTPDRALARLRAANPARPEPAPWGEALRRAICAEPADPRLAGRAPRRRRRPVAIAVAVLALAGAGTAAGVLTRGRPALALR